MRYMALLLNFIEDEGVRNIIISGTHNYPQFVHYFPSDMIIRAFKNEVRSQMRGVASPNEAAVYPVIAEWFNLLLGKSKASEDYWIGNLQTLLILKFSSYGSSP